MLFRGAVLGELACSSCSYRAKLYLELRTHRVELRRVELPGDGAKVLVRRGTDSQGEEGSSCAAPSSPNPVE